MPSTMDFHDREIFCTLTYSRDNSLRDSWTRSTSNTNRFLQRIIRKMGDLEYLRVFEPHSDGYCHIHLHIRFTTSIVVREHGIFLYDRYRNIIKSAWSHGFSDVQCAKYSHTNTIRYITKYITKNSSSNHLWRMVLSDQQDFQPKTNELGYPIKTQQYAAWKLVSSPILQSLDKCTFKWKKIKLLSWSRGYIDTFKNHKV